MLKGYARSASTLQKGQGLTRSTAIRSACNIRRFWLEVVIRCAAQISAGSKPTLSSCRCAIDPPYFSTARRNRRTDAQTSTTTGTVISAVNKPLENPVGASSG